MIIREGTKQGMHQRSNLMESLMQDKDRVLFQKIYESRGRRTKVRYRMGEMLEGIQDDKIAAQTALLLENQREYYEALDETTRLAYVGSFDRWSFPIVRAIFPNLVAHELVSVQPMDGPTSLVFFLKFIYGVTKGTALAGQDILENPNTDFMSRTIDEEVLGTGDGGTKAYSGSLAWTPVIAGRLTITDGTQVIVDTGVGTFSGDGTGTINYSTGAYAISFTANCVAGASIAATYDYDNEGSSLQAEMDMVLTSSPVTAQADRVVSKWSLDVATDYKIVHGLDAEQELVAAQVSEMKYELDHKVIADLFRIASNVQPVWSGTPASGISRTEHKLSFVDNLVQANNLVYKSSQRAETEWLIGGVDVCSLIESLPGFVGSNEKIQGRGVRKIGTLNNRWTIFKDSYLNDKVYMMGHKGENMWDTGYIYAPYQMFTQTPSVTLTDFLVRKGTWSRYGKKPLDGRFYVTGTISNYPW